MTQDARGRASSAPRRTLLPLLALLALSACHPRPAPIVAPPPASSVRLDQLRRLIGVLVAAPELSRGSWGISIRSLDRDETIYQQNADKLLMPASTMKVVTLAVAAERLGWQFDFKTSVSTLGSIHDGVLNGDLLIVGAGDPSLDDWDGAASAAFKQWADRLRESGVHTIAGRIIGDDNVFDDDNVGVGWMWDDLAESYSAGVSGLQFNQNTAQVLVRAGSAEGAPALLELKPSFAPLVLRNLATTAAESTISIVPVARAPELAVVGTVAVGAAPLVRNVSVENPTLYFASAVRDALVRNAIDVRGPAEDLDALAVPPDGAQAVSLTDLRSPNLTSIGRTMMKLSQNMFAESLLKAIGVQAQASGSMAAGRAAIIQTLGTWGVAAQDVVMVDGSGLSRYDLITPAALATILSHVYRDERLRGPFYDSLPIAGIDGTLSERMKNTDAFNNARAKTGSFTNARSFAGYVKSADGEMFAVSVMANNYGVPGLTIDRATDAIVVALAQFRR